MDPFSHVFNPSFMPHGHCYFWQPGVLWLHVISDLIICLSYYSIPIALMYFVRKRSDLAFKPAFVLFAIFIFSCGTTHLIDIWTTWKPYYWIEGVVKAMTAFVSLITAVILWPLLPKALKLPSPSQLQKEIDARELARQQLAEMNNTLEAQVEIRTAELLSAKEEAERANRAKSHFLANMSHELRTPLTSIIGFTDLLKAAHDDPDTQEDLNRIRRSSYHLLAIINDLLDLSKVESGHLKAQTSEFTLESLLTEIQAETDVLCLKNKNQFQVQLNLETDMHLATDFNKVKQVLMNLLSNACKFTQNGQVHLTLTQEQREDRDWIICQVDDTGIGIPEAHLSQLFQPFFQVDDASDRTYEGTGLGLAISQRFAQILQGELWIENKAEQGSRFIFAFPAMREEVKEEGVVV